MIGIHKAAACLQEANYCTGVFGNWVVMPFLDDDNGFWVN
jgi:hypothetical protein